MDAIESTSEINLNVPELFAGGTAIEFIDEEAPSETATSSDTTALLPNETKRMAIELSTDQQNGSSNSPITKLHRLFSVRRFFTLLAGLLILCLVFEGIVAVIKDPPTFLLSKINHAPVGVSARGRGSGCSPTMVDPVQVAYRSKHAFYTMLQSGLIDFPPPVFQGNSTKLCSGNPSFNRGWEYCLPITGRKDLPYCQTSGRSDLLNPLTNKTRCFGSVLHMLLVDIYDEMKYLGVHPAVLYGTLLGAVRDGRTIPFTEDVDIGYQMTDVRAKRLRRNLAEKGYHMFHQGIWRVCVAPTHSLASNLYDPGMHLIRGAVEAPYVDLYEMKIVNETTWRVAEAVKPPFLAKDRIEPFSQVMLHGMEYDTVADPVFFLKREYGSNYMTPKPRKSNR